MQHEVDWRHWLGAAVAIVALVAVGWFVMTRPSPQPTAPAPAGANPRMQDVPEFAPGSAPTARSDGRALPTAR